MLAGVMVDRAQTSHPQTAQTGLTSILGDTSGNTLPPLRLDPTTQPSHPLIDAALDEPVTPFGPEPRDIGGTLYVYFGAVMRADILGQKIAIRGTCISACTVYLGAKDVCVDPGAMLWFHAAQSGGKVDDIATMEMASYWPESVREWARRTGATKGPEFTRRRALTGAELISMGIRPC